MYKRTKRRRLVRDLPSAEQPAYKLANGGPGDLSTAELLAVVIGSGDALDLAYDLLAVFGDRGIKSLLDTPESLLETIDGVGTVTALRLRAVGELARRYNLSHEQTPRITSPADVFPIVADLCHETKEHIVVLVLDTRNRVMRRETITVGNVNTAVFRAAEVLRPAVVAGSAAVVLVHNHPSGDPSPSPEDVAVTRSAVQAGKLLDIEVLDHVIVAGGRYVSLKERGLGF